MNTVFYMLRNEFEADESYTGSDIMAVILKTIKVHCFVLFYFILFYFIFWLSEECRTNERTDEGTDRRTSSSLYCVSSSQFMSVLHATETESANGG